MLPLFEVNYLHKLFEIINKLLQPKKENKPNKQENA